MVLFHPFIPLHASFPHNYFSMIPDFESKRNNLIGSKIKGVERDEYNDAIVIELEDEKFLWVESDPERGLVVVIEQDSKS